MYTLLHSADELTKLNLNIDKRQMSKLASPTSVVVDEVICQAQGRRVDCELKFDKIKRILNNRVTERSPTLKGTMLGKAAKPFPVIEPFTAGNDPDTEARNAIITGKITQRVKDESEREKAIIATKASLLSWFHSSLEDYIHSNANPNRIADWDNNNWTEIMKHIRNWYLEPVSQNDKELTLERLIRDYRVMRQGAEQTLSEWETMFRILVKLVNERANANKSDLEQAKDFVDKLFARSYGPWKHECHMEENRQQQRTATTRKSQRIATNSRRGHTKS